MDLKEFQDTDGDISSQGSILQEIQEIHFDYHDRLNNFCFDENILLLLNYLKNKGSKDQCLILFQLLKEQMMLESDAIIRQIQPQLQESLLDYQQHSSNKAEIGLHNLYKTINALDFQKITDYISQSYDSSQDIRGKDIVMILGFTGVGKSTFIHYLAGSKIQKVENKDGLSHWEPSDPLYQSLQRVISKADAKSETKFVIPIKIKASDQEGNEFGNEDEVIICDTPGFNDSEGKESDIANLTGITKCISVCNSIKPIVLISEKQISDRGQGIKHLANIIKRMVNPQQNFKHLIDKFLFIFSKYQKDEDKKQLYNILKNIFENLNTEEKKDLEFTFVLKAMLQQTKIKENIAFFDLTKKNFEGYVFLERFIRGMQAIQMPRYSFTCFFTSESEISISEQLKQDQSRIQNISDLSSITNQWEYNITLIDDYINTEIQQVDKFISQIINLKKIDKQCITNFLNDKEQLSKISILQQLLPQAENLGKILDSALQNAITIIIENIKQELISLQQNNVNEYYEKLLFLSKEINDETSIQKFIAYIMENISNQMEKAKNFLQQDKFADFFDEIQLIINYIESCYFLAELNVKNKIENCFDSVINVIENQKHIILEKLKQFALNEENKKEIQAAQQKIKFIFQEFKKSKLKDQTCKEKMKNYQNSFEEEIENEYNIIEQKVKATVNQESGDLQGQKTKVIMLQLLSKTFKKLEQKFTNLVNLINQRMGQITFLVSQVTKDLSFMNNDTESEIKFQNLEEAFQIIQECQWIQELDQDIEYTTQKQKIFYFLKKLASNILEKLESIEITLDQTEDLIKIASSDQKMKKLKSYSKSDEELQNIIKEYEDKVRQIFEIYFDKINKLKNQQDVTYWEHQKNCLFLEKCIQNKIYKHETQTLLENLKENITNSCQEKEKYLQTSFDQLKKVLENKSLTEKERLLIQVCQKNILQKFEDMQKIEKCDYLKVFLEQNKSAYLIGQQQISLKRLWTKLKDIVEENEHIQQKWIFILQQLKMLDELDCSSQNKFSFSNLLSECYKKNRINVQNLKSGLDQQLNDNYLPKTLETLKQLHESASQDKENKDHQTILNDLKLKLVIEMKNIITQVQQYADKLNQIVTYSPIKNQLNEQLNNANQIITLYKQFTNYENHFKDYLDIEQLKNSIGQVEITIKKIANDGPNKIKQTFKNNNFKEFYDQINFMQNIFVILQNSFSIDEEFIQLRQIQDNCFEELKLKVENLNMDNPLVERFQLKSICSKLELVEDDIYQGFSKTLQDIYQKKLVDKLEQTKDKPINQQEEIIRKVKQFFDYLPSDMIKILNQQIQGILNADKVKQKIEDCFKQKNIQGLKKLQGQLADSGFYKQFMSDLEEFIEKENDFLNKQIISQYKQQQYLNFEKSLLNLIKFGLNSPLEFQSLSIEKLNNILEQIFFDQFKVAENQIQNILNHKLENSENYLDFFKNYCQLSISLIKVYQRLEKDEQIFLKELEYEHIFDFMQKQKTDVTNDIKQRIELIQWSEQDFSNFMDQFAITHYLQSFDYEQYRKLLENLISKQQKLQQQIEPIIKQNITAFKIQIEYEKYYDSFQKSLKIAQEIQVLAQKFNLKNVKQTLFSELSSKLNQIIQSIEKSLKNCFEGDILDEDVVKSINNIYLNSKYIYEYFSSLDYVKNCIDQKFVQSEFLLQIKKLFQEPQMNGKIDIGLITEYLSNMQRILSTYIYMEKVKTECEENINRVLKKYKDSKGSLEKLQIKLTKSKYGEQITKHHPFFKGFQICDTNLRIQRFGIDQVLSQIKGFSNYSQAQKLMDDVNINQLNDYYQKFEKKYSDYLERYLTHYNKIDFINLLKDIQKSVSQIDVPKFKDAGKIQYSSLGIVPDLLAGIFCCWTCINSKYYFELIEQSYENKQSFLLKPHPAQIVTIFRLLGIGYNTNYQQIQNNSLAQVLTGEGKSVILAALSCFYSLCGFSVKCACYSNQLSTRDYEEFIPLFEKLKIKDLILYGTFNRVCEEILNQAGDIRVQVSNYIQMGQIKQNKSQESNRQILLIDEVDVFFSKDFFGNNYDIIVPIQDTSVENLLDKIWSSRQELNLSFKSIQSTQEYQQCIAKYPKWAELIEEQTKTIIHDFKNFNNVIIENYKILNDKIYYKNQDQYLDNISYGYRTLYTYYQENQNSKISNSSLQKQKVFKINSGSFSYSELPKKFFLIKGVTGTLDTLSRSQLQLIQNNYQMNQQTLIPSVYGKSKFQFNEKKDIKVVPKEEYFNTITNEITKSLAGKNNQKRAVLAFFSSKECLLEYYNSQQFKTLKQNPQTYIMTEENSIEERKKIIQDATYSGAITLMTRIFGRGIDFQVNDTTIFQNYGIHVIQTFFSEDKSEETQTKGRTARQGEDGTYSMILQKDTLQAFLKTDQDIQRSEKLDEIYEVLDRNRQINSDNDFKSNLEYNQKASITTHQQSESFLKFLKDGNLQQAKKYLIQLNQGPKDKRTSKTLIVMDVTGSMSNLITQTKNTIQTTFEQARDILIQRGYDPQCFQIMICCFRSYSSKWQEIIQTSSWETNPDKLRSFLQTITASGGTYPGESVEVGLWWANEQYKKSPISQVIVLGDQPAHSQEEAERHRNNFGQIYWNTTPIKDLNYYVPECQQLNSKNVPVNTFYLKSSAKNSYQEIARLTNGISEYLDINSAQSSKKLTEVFVVQILKDIGNQDGRSQELIEAYRAKYS
ncbi:hypothetical protein ABPG72_013749 [Tetrahymena utriculariae]